MAYTRSIIGERWKLNILGFLLTADKLRSSELKGKMKSISERMLVKQLRELETDGLINRVIYPEVPPKVEYSLSIRGYSLEGILLPMSNWREIMEKR